MSLNCGNGVLRRAPRISTVLGLAAILALVPFGAGAATFVVDTTADENNGVFPDLSLREAVILANTNGETDDVILLPGGLTYTLTLTGAGEDAAATGDLDIVDDAGTAGLDTVRVRSQGPLPATIHGNGTDRVFDVDPSDAPGAGLDLADLTVRNGSASGSNGGGVRIQGASVVAIRDCAISGNSASNSGGGVFFEASGSLDLRNSTFTGNVAPGLNGGGLGVWGGTADVTGCTFSQNHSDSGGAVGVRFAAATLNLANCTLSGNTASFDGGGLAAGDSGVANVRNCIIAGNTAGGFPDVDNFLFAPGTIASNGKNVIGDKTGAATEFAADFGPVAANLVIDTTLSDNGGPTMTFLPVAAGLAENAGANADVPAGTTNDQRGGPRLVGTVDIGAVELGSVVVDTLTDENDGVGVGAGTSLREAIAATPSGGGVLFENGLFAAAPFPKQITLTLGQLALANSVTIAGPGADVLAVSGNDASRVFEVTAATATISGLTVRDGLEAGGAGIRNFAGVLNLNDLALLDNVSNNGTGGGALRNQGTGTIRAARCLVQGNSGTATGGAVRNNNTGSIEMTDCTVSGNTSTSQGAFTNTDGTTTLIGCTITGNSGTTGGGGLHFFAGTFNVRNCIVVGNTPSDASSGAFTSNGANVIGNKTGSTAFAGDLGPVAASAVIDTTLADNGGPTLTHALVAGGLAENAGTNADVPAASVNDQRGVGFTRIIGTNVDVGAYERNGVTIVPVEVSGIEID